MRFIQPLALGEICLLVSMSFAFAWIMHESLALDTPVPVSTPPSLASFLAFIGTLLFGKTTVSASTPGVWTCPVMKDGSTCQEVQSDLCATYCTTACIPVRAQDVQQCRLGTCFSSTTGGCSAGTPRDTCTVAGGQWFDAPRENVLQCRLGCCLSGQQAVFSTEQACLRQAQTLGTTKVFRPEIRTELACIASGGSDKEGACLIGQDDEGKNNCIFGTQTECQTRRGVFHEGRLCSAPSLNTSCQAQQRTGCVAQKDEVYWFDSCGNRENIYALPKTTSFNGGGVQPKSASCTLTQQLTNAGICGNCNYLQGSICKRAPGVASIGDFACRDLKCTDRWGNKRAPGESWCAYQGSTGQDTNRGTDTVGSRHFRETCVQGEVQQDACQDYRNEICVQTTSGTGATRYTTAACRLNRWAECVAYNNPQKPDEKEKCTQNPDCFVKQVSVGQFAFNLCTPKYVPGFDLLENGRGEGSEAICSMGSQKCTKVMVKGLGGWKCKANCQCDTTLFTEQMNNLCTSLGDCGMKANYLGTTSESYRVTGAPALGTSYRTGIMRYADERLFKDRPALAGSLDAFYALTGIPPGLGIGTEPTDSTAETRGALSMPIGMAGIVIGLAAKTVIGAQLLSTVGLATVQTATATAWATTVGGQTVSATASVAHSPALGAAGGAFIGATIGFALTSFLLDVTGVGRGLPPALTYALMAAGTVGGAIAGYGVLGGTIGTGGTFGVGGAGFASLGPAASLAAVGLIIIAVVIIIIVIMQVLGIGKVRKIEATFTCKPWQAPTGSEKCGTCGSDGFPCSRYACSALGQNCQLINEATDEPECVGISRDDVVPPVISPLTGVISVGHQYSTPGPLGFTLTGPEECLEPFSQVIFGLGLDEPGQCKYSTSSSTSFDAMTADFGLSTLFRRNHTMILPVPSIEALGYTGYQTNFTARQTLYVRCQDKNGNVNQASYGIQFCVKRGLDVTPPVVVAKTPSWDYVGFLATQQNVTLYTNEPATCRISDQAQTYDAMTQELTCLNDPVEDTPSLFGWACNTTVHLLARNDSTFYTLCKDQPWLIGKNVSIYRVNNTNYTYNADAVNMTFLQFIGSRSGTVPTLIQTIPEAIVTNITGNGTTKRIQTRNLMQQTYSFTVRKSVAPLRITEVQPNGTLTFGTMPASVSLVVRTGGGLDGTATCRYQFGEHWIDFRDTLGLVHRQTLSLYNGTHTFPIRCEDQAGNIAGSTVTFTIKADTTMPLIARAYGSGNTLTIITNEPSTCKASTIGCQETWLNGTLLSGTERSHTLSWQAKETYYVQCVDQYLNGPGSQCQAIVRRQGTA
ncbi:hypothetical protein FJZ22_00735 [Candidatus Pacearchaeota archaeon]|nr:hypothetical protein [Candidatus Pacearchaeota archaeon]